jgi:hypothetical protein
MTLRRCGHLCSHVPTTPDCSKLKPDVSEPCHGWHRCFSWPGGGGSETLIMSTERFNEMLRKSEELEKSERSAREVEAVFAGHRASETITHTSYHSRENGRRDRRTRQNPVGHRPGGGRDGGGRRNGDYIGGASDDGWDHGDGDRWDRGNRKEDFWRPLMSMQRQLCAAEEVVQTGRPWHKLNRRQRRAVRLGLAVVESLELGVQQGHLSERDLIKAFASRIQTLTTSECARAFMTSTGLGHFDLVDQATARTRRRDDLAAKPAQPEPTPRTQAIVEADRSAWRRCGAFVGGLISTIWKIFS